MPSSLYRQIIHRMVETGFKVADGLSDRGRSEVLAACEELDRAGRSGGDDLAARKTTAKLVSRLEATTSNAVVTRSVSNSAPSLERA